MAGLLLECTFLVSWQPQAGRPTWLAALSSAFCLSAGVRFPLGTDFSDRQCSGKKISFVVLAARHDLCGHGLEFGEFFRGQRSRGRFLLMKYGGGRFTPAAFLA